MNFLGALFRNSLGKRVKGGFKSEDSPKSIAETASIPKQFLGLRPYVVGFCALFIIVDFVSKVLKFLKIEFTKT